ncbi:DNA ligase [Thalassomonas actiniarum]|uniref:DNA ligase n=1 Tax=Thalassomonas actiniarum TaxID=485447 RepID=A0AAF0C494_9GAMM|nr:DNA ligase [Thalassomonas actiniarum]WDD99549.1 DNA ligase [Thalassomonas actiniarum]
MNKTPLTAGYSLSALLFLLFSWLLLAAAAAHARESQTPAKPGIQLASRYQEQENISEFFISEKLDGVRGYWTGKQLLTRQGNIINAPVFFTIGWPNIPLDGELWLGRNRFEQVSATVRTFKAKAKDWQQIRFMLFDLPGHKGTFSERIKAMRAIVTATNNPYLNMISQEKLSSVGSLQARLKQVVDNGGEGLMLHHQDAYYQNGRNALVMKLKQYQDAEAVVLAHNPGTGKYLDKLGSLLVKTSEGIVFKIGTGFSDQEREFPPPIGSTITYRYTGKTKNGVPKFASFMRQRH